MKQDTTKKKPMNNSTLPKLEIEFEPGNDKEYKVEAIINSTVYGKKPIIKCQTSIILFYKRAI